MKTSTMKDKAGSAVATGRERLAEKRLARVEDRYESLRSENEVLRREFKESQALQDRLLKALEVGPSSAVHVKQKPRRRWLRVLILGGAATAIVARREQVGRLVRQTFGNGREPYGTQPQSFPDDISSGAAEEPAGSTKDL
jgi:hypothetical protein